MNLMHLASRPSSCHSSLRMIIAICTACSLLYGCTAGKEYKGPQKLAHDLTSWEHVSEAGVTDAPADIGEWWKNMGDVQLDQLITMALENNLDLEQARSRIREARAQGARVQSSEWPTVDISAAASRQKSGDTPSGSLYNAGLDAAWEIDIFGRVKRSVEAAEADFTATVERGRDTQVTLLAEVALSYINVRSLQKRLKLGLANVDIQERTMRLIKSRMEFGLASELELKESESNLANTRSQLPPLETGLSQAMHRLAVLVAQKPGKLNEFLLESGDIPLAPLAIPIGIPADLLRRRPDIRQAERQLAAQSARVGVAEADLYPRFAFSGILSFQSTQTSNLFTTLSRSLALGPVFQWNIFNAGSVRNNITVQNERQKQALLNYEKTVLVALEEVENALVAYGRELDRRENLQQAVAASQKAVGLAESMYKDGLRDFSHVLDTQRLLFAQEDALAASNANVSGNLIRLYKALGGGWHEKQLLPNQ